LDDLARIVGEGMREFDVQWTHQTHTWHFEELGEHLPHFKHVHTIHAMNIYRAGGVWVKWKMFMTDDRWSTPILLVPAAMVPRIAALRPALVPKDYQKEEFSSMKNWLNKLDLALRAFPDEKYGNLDVDWVRRALDHQEPSLLDSRSLDEVLQNMLRYAEGARGGDMLALPPHLPEDALVTLCPGGDHAALPQDVLVQVQGVWEPTLPPGFVAPGMFIFTRNEAATVAHGTTLLFNMGRHLPDLAGSSGQLLVQWYLPPQSEEVAFKKGRRKMVCDLFGVWTPADTWQLDALREVTLPSALLDPAAILETLVQRNEDCTVPYPTLDALRQKHGLDMTALSLSSTARGNAYRQYVLLRRSV